MNFKNEIKTLEEDNDLLIESSINRLVLRIIKTFESNKIAIGKSVVENKINANLTSSLYQINKETCEKYDKFLNNIYKLLKEKMSELNKNEVKKLISSILKQIDNTKHPSLNETLFDNFIESMKAMTNVYDNDKLNKSLDTLLKKDSKDILNTINDSNKEFLGNQIKQIVIAILKS